MFKTARLLQIIAVVLALSLAAPVFADTYLRTITLNAATKLGATEVKPGDYTLRFDGSKVVLRQGRKVVAEAAAEWADTQSEVRADTVVIDNGKISEIRIEGKKRVIKIKP